MTLLELSTQYRSEAQTLQDRVHLLERQRCQESDETGQRLLERRIRCLSAMWRESRDLAALCEHYYDRGYHINGRYTI